MLTYEQFLLTKIAEECNEVAQRALKAQQFTIDEVQPGQALTNYQRLRQELCDLHAVVLMLEDHASIHLLSFTDEEIDDKVAKVNKFAELSRSLGMLEP